MMQKAFLVLSLMLLCIGSVWAQSQPVSENAPLLVSGVIRDGDSRQYALYRYVDGEFDALPVQDYYDGSLSPDGQWFAYRRTPPFLKALIEEGQGMSFGTAWDIALLSLQDGSERVIAVQPETIAATDEGYEGGIKRSLPSWSPDSRALAWTELDYPPQTEARLVVYDLESQDTRTLDEAVPLEALSVDGMPRRVSWGEPGIAVYSNDEQGGVAPAVRLYDPQTGLMHAVVLPFDESSAPLNGPLWVKNTSSEGNSDQVVIRAFQDAWQQIDPATGEVTTPNWQLKMVSAVNPSESLRLIWNIYNAEDEGAGYLANADGNPIVLMDDYIPFEEGAMGVPAVVFAPSGQAAAYLSEGSLLLWQEGTLIHIELPSEFHASDLFWGASQWQPGPEVSNQTGDAMGG